MGFVLFILEKTFKKIKQLKLAAAFSMNSCDTRVRAIQYSE